MQSVSINFSCSILTKTSGKLYRLLASGKNIPSSLSFENINELAIVKSVESAMYILISQIYELQLYPSYETSQAILQNMLEKGYSHRFYSRFF